jgi:hypothetical protein
MMGRLLNSICNPGDWEWTGRRRVLVESTEAWAWAPVLREAGYEVAVCSGPRPGELCPLLELGACATASAAHVIVSSLPSDVGPNVVSALRSTYPFAEIVDSGYELLA